MGDHEFANSFLTEDVPAEMGPLSPYRDNGAGLQLAAAIERSQKYLEDHKLLIPLIKIPSFPCLLSQVGFGLGVLFLGIVTAFMDTLRC